MNYNDVATIQELYNQVYAPQDVEELYKGKHGQSEKEYADSRSDAGKMISGTSKMSGAEYTHGRRVKAANPGMQPDVGGKTRPKSQGKMDRGTRADLEYRKANLKKEELELDQMIESLIERGHTEQEAYALVAQFTLDEDNVNEIFGLGGKSAKDRLANSDYMKKKNKEADEKAIQNLRDMMSKDPERQKRPSRINNEGYQRNPEKGEKEDKKYAPVRGERTPMPPRGDKRREDFEKWYAAQRR